MDTVMTRSARQIDSDLSTEMHEVAYMDSFPWHPGRFNPSSPRQQGYLSAILPSPDEILAEYLSNIIPGR